MTIKGQYIMEDGTKTGFNAQELCKAIRMKAQRNGVSRQEVMENISEKIGVSYSALKHWVHGHNAPSDLEKVKDIANVLEIDADTLLTEKKEKEEEKMTTNQNIVNHSMITVTPVFSSEKEAIRSIYVRIVDFIEAFRSETDDGESKMESFKGIFRHLMHIRLDVSKEIFNSLYSFTVNYLQLMVLIDRVFSVIYNEDLNSPDYSGFKDEYFESEDLNLLCFNPEIDMEMRPVCCIDQTSDDALLVRKALKKDWMLIEEWDPYFPFYEFEYLIDNAYARLFEILSR